MASDNSDYFNQPDAFRNLALEVENTTFWVSKEIISAFSPVFKVMLYGEFAEANKDNIQLPNKKAEVIRELLFCLTPTPKIKSIDDTNVDLMLEFADKYQIEDLRSRRKAFLITKLAINHQINRYSISIMASENPDYFNQPDAFRNLALEVQNTTFWVSKEILSAFSPVFKVMLYGEFAEANKDKIQLPNKKAEVIRELLFCLTPSPKIKSIDDTNVDLMLKFADEYQIEDLRSRCEAFLTVKLSKSEDGSDSVLGILRLASKHRLRPLLESCIKRCAVEFKMQKLQEILTNLRCGVVAALMLYKNACPADSKCQFRIMVDYCSRGGSYSHHHAKCFLCGFAYCVTCQGSKYNSGACSAPVIEKEKLESSMRDLLDRM